METISLLSDFGVSDVEIELDCKTVMDAFNSDVPSSTEFDTIISTCKYRLSYFSDYLVSLVRRQEGMKTG